MSECKTINCHKCGFELEETFVEQKCPRCQALIESEFLCGSCHNCNENITGNKSNVVNTFFNKLLSRFTNN